MGQLAGGVAHDFNNLITVIDAYAGLALGGLDESSPARSDIATIQEAAGRASALTAQLLAFGRRQVLQPELSSLNKLVASLEAMLRPLVGESIDLVIQLADGDPTVLADPGKLEQVVVNLVTNARDAMPQGGTLTIRVDVTEPDADHGRLARLSVTDTGSGMDEQTRRRIFEPFFTTKEQDKGTGLGLATVLGIVEQSGGRIEVASEPGGGTTFTVSLPCADSAPVTKPDRNRAAAGTETVLVVEDDELVRAATERQLRAAGYTVVTAPSGPDALRLCREQELQFQLLLTDVAMPRMNGPELAMRLGESYPQLKVLFMSGHIDEVVASDGSFDPPTRLIPKPFTAEQLNHAIRDVLDEAADGP